MSLIYVIATPIGNLADISQRAISTLQAVDKIVVEDTRHSHKLLSHLGIHKPLLALHDYNERDTVGALLNELQHGTTIALISDAGTPLISDPGYVLVHSAQQVGIKVVPIPGPCALICALSASGLPTDKFCFEGFLPAKAHARQTALQALLHETRTLVFYEAPHRILETLQDMWQIFGAQRRCVFARELTKHFETILPGTIEELLNIVVQDPNQQRGEIVLMVAGAPKVSHVAINPDALHTLSILLTELSVKQATSLASKITGVPKNILYDEALKIKP